MVTSLIKAGLYTNSVPEGEVDCGPGVEVCRDEKRQPMVLLLDEERDLGTAEDDALRAAAFQANDDLIERFPRGVLALALMHVPDL